MKKDMQRDGIRQKEVKTKMRPGENKTDFSKRVVTRRVIEILKNFRFFENLAGPNYNLTKEQIKKIFKNLDQAYKEMRDKFFIEKTEFTLEKGDSNANGEAKKHSHEGLNKPSECNWTDDPDTEMHCVKCKRIWRLGESIRCPNCEKSDGGIE